MDRHCVDDDAACDPFPVPSGTLNNNAAATNLELKLSGGDKAGQTVGVPHAMERSQDEIRACMRGSVHGCSAHTIVVDGRPVIFS